MDVLSSRILLRPGDLGRSRGFYRDVLGLAVYREFGRRTIPGGVLPRPGVARGLRARGRPSRALGDDLDPGTGCPRRARPLAAAGVPVIREPAAEPWALIEMQIEDPDGIRIVLVEVPADHPLRRARDRRHRQDDDLYAADECVRSGA